MLHKTIGLIIICLFLSAFLAFSLHAQDAFNDFKKSLLEGEKSGESFEKFKKELEAEYRLWLKHEQEWEKITLEDKPVTPVAKEKPAQKRPPGKKGVAKRLQVEKRSERRYILPLPADSFRVSSRFGYRNHPIHKRRVFHSGIDYAARRGTRVFAAAEGKILRAGVAGGYGNYIMVEHAHSYKTAYAHLDRVLVKKNQAVRQGELIGLVGTSGRSTGPHLHYEVINRNKKIDPEKLPLN